MKTYSKIIFFVCLSVSLHSQEICDNGIDDDNDGLIDLNDSNCNCNDSISLLPNSSFENYTTCPDNASQVNRCENWIVASNATSDYFNTCDFYSLTQMGYGGLLPPQNGNPNGNGYVGFHNVYSSNPNPVPGRGLNGNYKEYVGTCLPSALLAGKTYKLKLLVGFGHHTPSLGIIDHNTSPSFAISIFGNSNCSSIPFNNNRGYDCPIADGNNFVELASNIVSGSDEWVETELIFTPSINTKVLVIGPNCLKATFDEQIDRKIEYYYLDIVSLKEEKASTDVSVLKKGKYCENNIYLKIYLNLNEKIQWYKNGIALVDKTNNTLQIDSSEYGKYTYITYDANNKCLSSNEINIKPLSKNCEKLLLFTPNAFTPNIDNTNDYFKPIFNDKLHINDFQFQIFNRWGQIVFKSNEFNNGWDGTHNGVKISNGIYIWQLTYKEKNSTEVKIKRGHVNLIR